MIWQNTQSRSVIYDPWFGQWDDEAPMIPHETQFWDDDVRDVPGQQQSVWWLIGDQLVLRHDGDRGPRHRLAYLLAARHLAHAADERRDVRVMDQRGGPGRGADAVYPMTARGQRAERPAEVPCC